MERRDFIKTSAALAAVAGLASCASDKTTDGKEISKGDMPLRNLCGDEVSLLGFGAMRFPTIKLEDGSVAVDQDAVNELIDYAMEHGINYYDTAWSYVKGKSERALARALQKYPRDSYFIATKLTSNKPELRSFKKGKAMLEGSLKIFNTDHIDYYLLHSLNGYDNFKERFLDNGLMDHLLEKRRDGTLRHLGFSFHGSKEGFDSLMALHEEYHWDFVQIQMNYSDWKHPGKRNCEAEYLYSELRKRNIPITVMEPLLGGRLADMPAPLADMLKKEEPGKSLASWAFRFCAGKEGVLTVLSGMTCLDHIKDNLDTFCNLKPLNGSELRLLDNVAAALGEVKLVACTGCEYCMPCPYGIDIPGIFSFYNRQITDGSYVVSGEQKDYERKKRRFLLSYGKSVPARSQADHCIGCGRCVRVCPQNIDVPNEMRRIDLYVERLKQSKL